MEDKRQFRWFKDEACDRCGECFIQCPVLNLGENEAREEIEALINGDIEKSKAFRLCSTCNLCDFICPKEANPYELILENFNEYEKQHGLPCLAKLVFPNEPENIWSGLRGLMAEDELSLVGTWERNLNNPNKQILLTGFYINLVPYLAKCSVLDELRPVTVGSESFWGCGGDINKLGLTGLTEQIIELVQGQFTRIGVEKVVCFMQAEAAMLSEILPKMYGADFKFEAVPLDYWIWDQIDKGNISIVRKLNMRTTVHDNCLSRYLGGESHNTVRKIVEATGCEIVEMEHNRSGALCCGWGSTVPTLYGANSGNLFNSLLYLLYSLYRRLQEAESTRAEVMVTNCPACYIFLSLIAEVTNSRIKIYHPVELVEMAAGKSWTTRNQARAWDILSITTNLIIKWLTSGDQRKRFFPKSLETSSPQRLPECPPEDARRIELLSRFLKGPLVQNPLSRNLIACSTKLLIAGYRKRMALK